MISKAPSNLESKEDHKTGRASYLKTPEVFSKSFIGYFNTCVSGRSFAQSKIRAFRCYVHMEPC